MISGRMLLGLATGALMWASPALAQESPVLGTWETAAETPMGNFESSWTFSETDGGYAIAIEDGAMPGAGGGEAPAMESTISELEVEGTSFSFKRSLTTPQGPLELSYQGTVEGDQLTAEASSSFGPIPITGTRAD